MKLCDLVVYISTGLNPRNNFKLNMPNSSIKYITIKNIKNNKIVIDNNTDFIDSDAEKMIQKRAKIENGNILFCSIGDVDNIGNSCIVDNYDQTWNINESLFNIKPNKNIHLIFRKNIYIKNQLAEHLKVLNIMN